MLRHLKILEYALSALRRRAAKNLGIAAAFTLVVAALSSVLFLSGSLREEAARLFAAAPDVLVQKLVAGRHDLIPASAAARIAAIPGVSAVGPRYWGYWYDPLTGANYTVQSVPSGEQALPLLSGRLPNAAGECAIGSGVARVRRIARGDDLVLIDAAGVGRSFEVVGLFTSDSALLTNDLVLLGETDLKEFFALPADRATDLAVTVPNPAEVPTVARKITALLPGTRVVTRLEIARTYDAVFTWRSGMALVSMVGALFAFALLAWDKATGLSAAEQHEIGVLKAIGWDTADVLELKIWEGIAVSAVSFLLGIGLGFVHVFLLGAPLLAPALKGWSVLFPAFSPVPAVDALQVATIGFLTVVPYIASCIVPSWKAAIADPDAVLRG